MPNTNESIPCEIFSMPSLVCFKKAAMSHAAQVFPQLETGLLPFHQMEEHWVYRTNGSTTILVERITLKISL
jgi:hypothetical protein